jgi:hypothetical protein
MGKHNSIINLTELRCDVVNWMNMPYGSDKLLCAITETSGYIKGGEFLEESRSISCSFLKADFHRVRYSKLCFKPTRFITKIQENIFTLRKVLRFH